VNSICSNDCGGVSQITTAIDKVHRHETYNIILTIATNRECEVSCDVTAGPQSPVEVKFVGNYSFTPYAGSSGIVGNTTQATQYYTVYKFKRLKQYKTYSYSCDLNDGEEYIGTELRFPKEKDHVRIASFGDWDVEVGNITTTYLTEHKHKYDALVTLGDYAYNMCNEGNNFMNSIKELTMDVPLMVVAGNHEGNDWCENANNLTSFDDLRYRFNMPNKSESQNMFYSFDIKDVHFAAINTEIIALNYTTKYNKFLLDENVTAVANEMVAWLDHDLGKSKKKWKVVLGHRPLYTSYYINNFTEKDQVVGGILRAVLEDIFLKHHVDLVLSGDVHAYERMFPIREGEKLAQGPHFINPEGPVYLTCGNAGQKNNPNGVTFKTPFIRPTAFVSTAHGFCDIIIREDRIISKYVVTDTSNKGDIVDEFTITKTHHHNHHGNHSQNSTNVTTTTQKRHFLKDEKL